MFSVIGIEDGVKDKGSRTWGIRGFTWTHTLSERSFSSPEQVAVAVPYIFFCLLAHFDVWATLKLFFFHLLWFVSHIVLRSGLSNHHDSWMGWKRQLTKI
jgi:hypothetical protein